MEQWAVLRKTRTQCVLRCQRYFRKALRLSSYCSEIPQRFQGFFKYSKDYQGTFRNPWSLGVLEDPKNAEIRKSKPFCFAEQLPWLLLIEKEKQNDKMLTLCVMTTNFERETFRLLRTTFLIEQQNYI